ncbi:hypothetical protein MHB43_23725 [Paenibacillus sp. FSL H8-0317]|uniref:hypothetical protein n=1 Tax=Paenibacillus sp. FSL H8-0317 TaxID=2921385 RepID=UPI003245C9A1
MSFNKIFGAGVALSVLLSASSASAGALEDRVKDTYTNPPITVENPDDPIITPMDVQLIISTNHSSYASFEKSFTMDPRNGEDANLWVRNTSTDTIYLKISMNGNSPLEVPIDKGAQKTIQLVAGVTTSFKVEVVSKTGHKIDMTISARQY